MNETQPFSRLPLADSGLTISPLGLGAWSWGDKFFWGYQQGYGETDVKEAFAAAVQSGIDFFDTAESYGMGRSEKLLGKFARAESRPVVIATKCFPYPYRLSERSLGRALHGSLKRLGMAQVGLYQMHWPFPPVSIDAWMNALADAVEAGRVKAVGVSNYNLEQTKRACEALARRGLRLASNQVSFSLLQRKPEQSGLLAYCRANGIVVIAYSPLAMGMLSGKYRPDSPPSGLRRAIYRRDYLARIQPLITLMREIGQDHNGKTPAEVALNWVMCKGAVPIAGAKTAAQVRDNAGALGWRLGEDEVAALEEHR